MKNDGIFLGEIETLVRQAVMNRIFAQSREIRRIHSLFLNPQNHHDIRIFDGFFDVVCDGQIIFYEMREIIWN